MEKLIKKISSLKNINHKTIVNKDFLIEKDKNIEIYYAPFDYINQKAKIMIVGITPGFQQMLQSYFVINEGKSLKTVKDQSSFKGSMRVNLIKFLNELEVNKYLKIKSCESLFDKDSNLVHTTSLVKYPVFDKGKNYSGSNILKKRILINFIEKNFVKELRKLQDVIIVPLGNTVSSTIDHLNEKFNLKLKCFLKGFPHPSGLNGRRNQQFKENKYSLKNTLKGFRN